MSLEGLKLKKHKFFTIFFIKRGKNVAQLHVFFMYYLLNNHNYASLSYLHIHVYYATNEDILITFYFLYL